MASLMSLYQQGHSLQQERKPAAVAAAKSQDCSVLMSAWDVGRSEEGAFSCSSVL